MQELKYREHVWQLQRRKKKFVMVTVKGGNTLTRTVCHLCTDVVDAGCKSPPTPLPSPRSHRQDFASDICPLRVPGERLWVLSGAVPIRWRDTSPPLPLFLFRQSMVKSLSQRTFVRLFIHWDVLRFRVERLRMDAGDTSSRLPLLPARLIWPGNVTSRDQPCYVFNFPFFRWNCG